MGSKHISTDMAERLAPGAALGFARIKRKLVNKGRGKKE